jgi:tight adherence protein C
MTLLIAILSFVVIASAISVFGYHRYVVAGKVYETLNADSVQAAKAAEKSEFYSVRRIAHAVGSKLPQSVETASLMQRKLLSAGYRDTSAPTVLYGLKLMLMAAVGLTMIVMELRSDGPPAMRLMGILVGVVAGFRLPDYFLARQIKRRKKMVRKALPDALDLIIVCAEAGLTIDRCFRSVTQQLKIVHKELSEEFALFTAEISAGLRRKEALDNLALRTDETEVRKFVGVLNQADRFGTSMGEALRTHADYLRVRRRQEAEEKASKVSVKMIFPIFFFIMPCMILVTVGPAVIVIMKQLLPALQGAK